jgi:hypothetical protein
VAPVKNNETVRIAIIAIVAVALARMIIPKIPGAASLASYL